MICRMYMLHIALSVLLLYIIDNRSGAVWAVWARAGKGLLLCP